MEVGFAGKLTLFEVGRMYGDLKCPDRDARAFCIRHIDLDKASAGSTTTRKARFGRN
jgi:hypothetical protein